MGSARTQSALIIVVRRMVMCLIWGTTWKVIQIGLEGSRRSPACACASPSPRCCCWPSLRPMGVKLGRRPARARCGWSTDCSDRSRSPTASSTGPSSGCRRGWPRFCSRPIRCSSLSWAWFVMPVGATQRCARYWGDRRSFGGRRRDLLEDLTTLGGPHVAFAAGRDADLAPGRRGWQRDRSNAGAAGVHPFSLTAVPMAMTARNDGCCSQSGHERDAGLRLEPRPRSGRCSTWRLLGSALTFTLYYWLLTLRFGEAPGAHHLRDPAWWR